MNTPVTDPVVNETTRLFEGIGRIVVSFQQIEQWLAEILAMLLRMREKDDRFLVSAAMSFGQKVDLLVDLYPKRKRAHLKDVDLIVAKECAVYSRGVSKSGRSFVLGNRMCRRDSLDQN